MTERLLGLRQTNDTLLGFFCSQLCNSMTSPIFLFDAPLNILRDAEELVSSCVLVRLKNQHGLAESAVAPAVATDVTSKAGTTGSSLVSRNLDFLFSLAPFPSSFSSLHQASALLPGTPGVGLCAFIARSAQRTPRSGSSESSA